MSSSHQAVLSTITTICNGLFLTVAVSLLPLRGLCLLEAVVGNTLGSLRLELRSKTIGRCAWKYFRSLSGRQNLHSSSSSSSNSRVSSTWFLLLVTIVIVVDVTYFYCAAPALHTTAFMGFRSGFHQSLPWKLP